MKHGIDQGEVSVSKQRPPSAAKLLKWKQYQVERRGVCTTVADAPVDVLRDELCLAMDIIEKFAGIRSKMTRVLEDGNYE